MSERDELAEEISGHPIGGGYYATQVGMAEAREIADAVLAAGYRKPRTITTVEELDALRVGSIIAELTEADAPAVACKTGLGDWGFLGDDPQRRYQSTDIYEDGHPALRITVLYEPEATK